VFRFICIRVPWNWMLVPTAVPGFVTDEDEPSDIFMVVDALGY